MCLSLCVCVCVAVAKFWKFKGNEQILDQQQNVCQVYNMSSIKMKHGGMQNKSSVPCNSIKILVLEHGI